MIKEKNKNTVWKGTALVSVVLLIITFTPLVMPYHTFHPELLGMPYSLWMGILIILLMLMNIFAAVIFHPGKNNQG